MTNKETTISKPIEIIGIGIHTGEPIMMKLRPAKDSTGIVFYRTDLNNQSIKLDINHICKTDMATTICKDDFYISTIEHLLSAIYAYDIDNINIYVNNMEIPILDGSSIGFCKLLDKAGIKYLEKNKKIFKITKEICVKDENKYVKIEPSDVLRFEYEINFEHKCIGNMKYNFDFSKQAYIENIAPSRTFGFLKDLEYLQSKGLAKGASMSNAIALDENKILNKEPLRYDNEFVRHKILDAIGDMSILSTNMIGKYSAYLGSHKLNSMLVKEILNKQAYEII
jgi:UDP-3-O-[3-hydroxymyristoyl] N-acetylglucosamine deacetylase